MSCVRFQAGKRFLVTKLGFEQRQERERRDCSVGHSVFLLVSWVLSRERGEIVQWGIAFSC